MASEWDRGRENMRIDDNGCFHIYGYFGFVAKLLVIK